MNWHVCGNSTEGVTGIDTMSTTTSLQDQREIDWQPKRRHGLYGYRQSGTHKKRIAAARKGIRFSDVHKLHLKIAAKMRWLKRKENADAA